MKEIKLTNCEAVALVSDEDYEYLAGFNWHRMTTGYAASTMGHDPRRKGESHSGPKTMHRIVTERATGPLPEGSEVDHADRNKLNNQRENLRICTRIQNNGNRSVALVNGRRYKGVARRKNKWIAYISHENVYRHLGMFNTEDAAAAAYNRAAREKWGEFAVLNPVPDDVQDAPDPIRFNNKRGSSSQYRGVSFDKQRHKWIAQVSRKGLRVYLGIFASETEAARAYDRKAYELFGDAAPLNFPDEKPT